MPSLAQPPQPQEQLPLPAFFALIRETMTAITATATRTNTIMVGMFMGSPLEGAAPEALGGRPPAQWINGRGC